MIFEIRFERTPDISFYKKWRSCWMKISSYCPYQLISRLNGKIEKIISLPSFYSSCTLALRPYAPYALPLCAWRNEFSVFLCTGSIHTWIEVLCHIPICYGCIMSSCVCMPYHICGMRKDIADPNTLEHGDDIVNWHL